MRSFVSEGAISACDIGRIRRQPLTIPDHDTLKPGLLHRLIRDAHLDLEEFLELPRVRR